MGLDLKFSSFKLGGEIRGYQTVIKDQYTNDPVKREVIVAKNGNSLRYDSVDPSLLESNFWIGGTGKSLGWKLGGGTTVTGSSVAAGLSAFLKINYQFEATASHSEPIPTASPHSQERPDVEKFQEDVNDGVNQELFEGPGQQQPKPVIKIPAKTPNQQDTTSGSEQQLQEELKKTEFQIELKRKKKKIDN